MSNHFHLVLKLCSEQAETWTDAEVIQRWTSLYKGPLLVQKWQAGDALIQAEQQAVSESISIYRQRLGSLSWFMKCLNEPIAREANKENGGTGHFWESRFKSQALLNEESLLSCMAYVDLNPIRAKMASTPEDSDHTSIQERITPQFNLADAIHQQIEQQCLRHFELPLKPLTYFEGNITDKEQTGILFGAQDYIQLVDYTGRIIRPDNCYVKHLSAQLDERVNSGKHTQKPTITTTFQKYRLGFSDLSFVSFKGARPYIFFFIYFYAKIKEQLPTQHRIAPVSPRLVELGITNYHQWAIDEHNIIFYRVADQENIIYLLLAMDSRQHIEKLLYELVVLGQ